MQSSIGTIMVVITYIIVLIGCVPFVSTSKCIVSRWRDWSECIGDCNFAQRVRNRDVVRPPFPENSLATGRPLMHGCPPLYEVEYCIPQGCEEGPQTTPFDSLHKTRPQSNTNENKNSSRNGPIRNKTESIQNIIEQPKRIYDSTTRAECISDNQKCCRILRSICSNGKKPKFIVRWHRKENEPFCRPYNYPYCGSKYELFEKPMPSEEVCHESCFNQAEKAILPSLKVI